MSTNVPGFQSFLRFFASFCIGQISHQQHIKGLIDTFSWPILETIAANHVTKDHDTTPKSTQEMIIVIIH